MANKIRKLAIGKEVKERFIYAVNLDRPIFTENIEGKKYDYFICEIIETELKYKIYVEKRGVLKEDIETQHWKDEMKNEIVHPEYFLD